MMRRAVRPPPRASPIEVTGDEIDSGRDGEGCLQQPSAAPSGGGTNEGNRAVSEFQNMSLTSADRAAGGVALMRRAARPPPHTSPIEVTGDEIDSREGFCCSQGGAEGGGE